MGDAASASPGFQAWSIPSPPNRFGVVGREFRVCHSLTKDSMEPGAPWQKLLPFIFPLLPFFCFYLSTFYILPLPFLPFPLSHCCIHGDPMCFPVPSQRQLREAEKGQTCHCPWEPSSSTETCTWHQQRADCLEQEQGRMGAAPWMDVPMSLCLAGWHSSLTISLCQAAPLGSAH